MDPIYQVVGATLYERDGFEFDPSDREGSEFEPVFRWTITPRNLEQRGRVGIVLELDILTADSPEPSKRNTDLFEFSVRNNLLLSFSTVWAEIKSISAYVVEHQVAVLTLVGTVFAIIATVFRRARRGISQAALFVWNTVRRRRHRVDPAVNDDVPSLGPGTATPIRNRTGNG